MKGYKAFEAGMICRGKQYAENTVFEEAKAKICESGMHFCENPLDALDYYPLIGADGKLTEFADVEAMDKVKTDDNKKFCTTKLKVGAKFSVWKLGEIGAEFLREKIANDANADKGGDCAKQVGGDCAKQVGGYSAQQVGGNSAQQVGGNSAKQVGGDCAKQVGGYCAKQVGGDCAKQVGGNSAQQVGGYSAQQVGGDCAKQVGGYSAQQVGGDYAKQEAGKNSIMISGEGGRYKAGLHSVLVGVWRDDDGNIAGFKAAQIDGETLKPDTWYAIKNGEFAEVGEE